MVATNQSLQQTAATILVSGCFKALGAAAAVELCRPAQAAQPTRWVQAEIVKITPIRCQRSLHPGRISGV